MSSIFDFINIPLGFLIRFFYNITHNYAIAILLFAIFIKVILLPLGIKQQKNQVKQASLRPKEMAIRKKYAGRDDQVTKQKMNQEVMDLYQKENFNPMGGCLPMLIELPIIWCLFTVITRPLRYICQFSEDVISQIGEKVVELGGTTTSQITMVKFIKENFSSFSGILPDGTTQADLPNFMVGPFDLSVTPSVREPSWLWAIPILTFIIVFLSMRLTRKFTYQAPGTEDQVKSMQLMDFTMPLFSVWIDFTVPAIVGLYWMYNNILTSVRTIVLNKLVPIPKFTDEELKQAQKEYEGKVSKTKASAEKPRSLHHIDDDDFPEELRKSNQKKNQSSALTVAPAKLKDESDRNADSEDKEEEDSGDDAPEKDEQE